MDMQTLKLQLNSIPREEIELNNKKVFEVEELNSSLRSMKRKINEFIQNLPNSFLAVIEEISTLFKKAGESLSFYDDLCVKARSRVEISLDGIVDEGTVRSETVDCPGKNILYRNMLKLKTPDYIFALMQQKVLKNREINRSLAFEVKNNPEKIFSFEELGLKDKGAAIQSHHRALMTITEALIGKVSYDLSNEELCFFQGEKSELRAVFVSIGNQNRKMPSLSKIKQKFGPSATFNPRSEASLVSETEVKIHAGSIHGVPIPIRVKVPYFIRSYSVVV